LFIINDIYCIFYNNNTQVVMETLLHKLRVFIILLLLFAFSGIASAQCTIAGGVVNSSTLVCNTAPLRGCTPSGGSVGILYIGNVTPTPTTTLYMNAELNLTCLGPIQLIVRDGASMDFSSGNNRLYLAEGSSIIIQPGGGLVGGSCNASERIYIGTNLLASCNGGAGADVSFADIVSFGGTGSATSNSPVCVGNSINLSATHPIIGEYEYSWSGPGLTATFYDSSPDYTTPATVSGIYQVKMRRVSDLKIMIAETTVTVLSTAAPTASVTLQPTCSVSTGTITITAPTGSGMTYSIDGLTYTTTGIFASVGIGTYNVTAKNSSGCISPGTSVVIALPTKTWDGSSWSPSAPTSADNIVFNGSYGSSSDLAGCSCQVNPGVAVVFNIGHTLTVTNGVTISGTGTLTFKDKSSLVQINNVANSGNITYERITNTNIRNTDFTYWSSPVSPQTLYNLSPNTLADKYFSYEVTAASEVWKQESSGITMAVGKGYIIRGPEPPAIPPPPPSPYLASFYGTPNNGHYSITGIFPDKSYLIGNPYPSALDADKFLTDNTGVLDGTLYFWTHNTAIDLAANIPNPGSGAYAYSSDDYATYNLTGGVVIDGVTYVKGGTIAPSGGTIPSGKIGAGQAFFASSQVTISGANEIVFNNNMRVGVGGITGDNSQFFKFNIKSKETNTIEKNRVWLNLSNSQGAFKQTLIGYLTGATNDYDSRFDGKSLDGNEFVDFYSINQGMNLVIQGRALPFKETDEVSLGYRTAIDGIFTINIGQIDGLLASQDIFIEDKNAKVIKNLKEGAYSFTTEKGTFNDRFILRYTNKAEVGKNFNTEENTVLVSNKNKQIKINSLVEKIDKVLIYGLAGRKLYQKTNVNNNELSVSNLVPSQQVLVVKIILQNGQMVTNKIIY
jgi:hypothetical protein